MIADGIRLKSKVKNLYDCQKACELIPLCYSGDYNPWEKSCYLHNYLTACDDKITNKRSIHFSRILCDLDDFTDRNLVELDSAYANGILQKGIKDVKTCLQKCLNTGGGIASTPANIANDNQVCFGIDFNFNNHQCYIHTDEDICDFIDTPFLPNNQFDKAGVYSAYLCPNDP